MSGAAASGPGAPSIRPPPSPPSRPASAAAPLPPQEQPAAAQASAAHSAAVEPRGIMRRSYPIRASRAPARPDLQVRGMSPALVLASASPRRLELLTRIGVSVEVAP